MDFPVSGFCNRVKAVVSLHRKIIRTGVVLYLKIINVCFKISEIKHTEMPIFRSLNP